MQRSPLLRAEQVAQICCVSPRVAADLMQQMPHINIGRSQQRPRWAVYEDDLYAFLDSRKARPESEPQPRKRRKRANNVVNMSGMLDEHGHILRRK